jgi:hypothetical protein
VPAAEVDGVADGETGVGFRGILADDELGKTGMEHAALNDFHEGADRRTLGETPRTSTLASVPVLISGMGTTPTTSWVTRAAPTRRGPRRGLILYDFYRIESDAAHHFGGRAGAQQQGVAGRAGRYQSGTEAARKRKHGHEDADRAGNAENGNDRGGPTRANAAEIVRDGYVPIKGASSPANDSARPRAPKDREARWQLR